MKAQILNDLRNSHFNLGNAPITTESSAQSQFKAGDQLAQPKDTTAIKERMQKGSF